MVAYIILLVIWCVQLHGRSIVYQGGARVVERRRFTQSSVRTLDTNLQLTVHVTDLTLGSAAVFVDSTRPGMCRVETGSIFPPNKAVFGLARNLSASQKRVSEREAGVRGPQGAAACVRYRHRLTVYNFENPVHRHPPNRLHPLFTKDRVIDSHRAITIYVTELSISVGIDTSVQVASEGFDVRYYT